MKLNFGEISISGALASGVLQISGKRFRNLQDQEKPKKNFSITFKTGN